tara:strand:- start:98 stop:1090 length:993 start_codon:yes stop_codon:yes gene_type:complete
MKVGIIGTGLMAEIYSDIIKKSPYQLSGVLGNTEKKTTDFAKKYDIDYVVESDYEKFFNEFDFDTVIITTPEWVRLDPIKFSVDFNKHIILEKPFSSSWSEALELQDVLKDHKKALFLCHVLRYSPRFHPVINLLEDKKIFHIDSSRNSNKERFKRIQNKCDPCFWLAPHDVDMILHLMKDEVDTIFAITNSSSQFKDLLSVMIRFKNNKSATFRNIWGTPPISNISKGAYFNIWHDEGAVEIDDSNMNIRIFNDAEVTSMDSYEDFFIFDTRSGFFKPMLEHFLYSISKGEYDCNLELKNALKVTEVCQMISRSISEKREISKEDMRWT